MLPLRLRVILAGLLLTAGTAFSADDDYDEARLCELFRQGHSDQAWAYGQNYRDRHEGEPGFDYCYGAAAIDMGQVGEGVFALERVLLADPDNLAARLELARGYFLLEEYARARDEFQRVLAANPPPAVVANIERYLRAIRLQEGRYLTTAKSYLQIGGGYDDNVNSGPDDRSVYIPALGTGLLSASALSHPSPFASLSGAVRVTSPLNSPGWALYGGVLADARWYNEEPDFNYLILSARGGIERRRNYHRFRLGALGQTYRLNKAAYRNLAGLEGEWKYQRDPHRQWQAFTQLTRLQYPDQADRDSYTGTLGLGLTHNFRGQLSPILFGNAYLGKERPVRSNPVSHLLADRIFAGGMLGSQLTLHPNLALTARLSLSKDRYGAEDLLFLKRRSDLLALAEVQMRWLLHRHWSVVGTVNYTRNDSNINIYDYKRLQGSLNLRLDFD